MKYIDLTTDFNPGDLDTGTYAHVAITQYLHHPGTSIQFFCNYGNVSGGVFTAGKTEPKSFMVLDSAYATLMAETAVDGNETVRDAMDRVLLDYLIDEGEYAGSVV